MHACVVQCATKRRRKNWMGGKQWMKRDWHVEQAAVDRLHLPLRAVGACTVNVHLKKRKKKHLLIVNQAAVRFDVPSAFGRFWTRRSSLNLSVWLLFFVFSWLNFHFWEASFTPHPPANNVEQWERLHHRFSASYIPMLSWKQFAPRRGAFSVPSVGKAPQTFGPTS